MQQYVRSFKQRDEFLEAMTSEARKMESVLSRFILFCQSDDVSH
jgi:hypothetical protein